MKVIEKNKTKILSGLIFESAVNSLKTSSAGEKENANNITAPIRAIIQYVFMLIFPILIFGNKNNDMMIVTNVTLEITMVGIITTIEIMCLLMTSVNKNLI